MPLRASPQEVRSVLNLEDADQTDVVVFLETANMVVDEELAAKGLSSARLKNIELYLAAHYATVAIEKGGITRSKTGESEEGYRQDFTSKPNLSMTRYGQQALALDTSGVLAALDAPGGKAEFRVVSSANKWAAPGFCD